MLKVIFKLNLNIFVEMCHSDDLIPSLDFTQVGLYFFHAVKILKGKKGVFSILLLLLYLKNIFLWQVDITCVPALTEPSLPKSRTGYNCIRSSHMCESQFKFVKFK